MAHRVQARLDRRLARDLQTPMVVALSGGGDSLALLMLVSDWAETRGRRVVAVTVDHGLNVLSPDWSQFCAGAARDVGAEWIEAKWTGDKPATGLTAAARAARHALIADVARRVGARVILTGHTADDLIEADWMRSRAEGEGGSSLGRMRDWTPSPAWPEGRGLMLFRPLLPERRVALRDLLTARGLSWIEDPANLNPRFGRARARRALSGKEPVPESGTLALPPAELPSLPSIRPLAFGAGFEIDRDPPLPLSALSAVLVSASGGHVPPRGERLAALARRLSGTDDVTATLSGTRIVATGNRVVVGREAGELSRRSIAAIPLMPDVPTVWDGRIEATLHQPGWRITAAQGVLNRLSDADRSALAGLPAWARGAVPVLIRDETTAPVLAGGPGQTQVDRASLDQAHRVQTRFLSSPRLNLTLSGFGLAFPGETTQETDLFAPVDGETPTTDLFSVTTDEPAPHPRAPQDRKPR